MAANGGEQVRPNPPRRKILIAAGLGVVAAAIGIVIGLTINWFPVAASKQAGPIDTLWDVLIIASVPIFVIVTTVVLFSVRTFRMRPGEENADGPPIHGNTKLEVYWTLLPAVILIGLCAYAYTVLHKIEKKPAGHEMVVDVYGQQFTWTFTYHGTGGKTFSNAQLYLPKGQSVEFNVHSKDVLHDFWVPAFRMKIDAVPGITTHYRVTPTRLGNYPVVCAELCGLGHAFMRQTSHVLPPTQFASWMQKQTAPAAPAAAAGGGATTTAAAAPAPGSPQANAAGKQVFVANQCGGCHTLAEAGSNGQVGPNLDKFLPKYSQSFIRTSIVKPSAYVEKGFPANVMPPNFGQTIKPADLDSLVNYLYSVTHKKS